MPRELLHWNVLDIVSEKLVEVSPELALILKNEREAAQLGAMVHDAPYYFQFGGKPPEEIAALLHGSYKNDTFKPLLLLAEDILKSESSAKEALWAFLLGMFTHLATDVTFHPMVYWYTGDYYDYDPNSRREARRRHRLFETYLDAWFASPGQVNSLLGLQRKLGPVYPEIVALLNRNLTPKHFGELEDRVSADWQDQAFWGEALRYMGLSQFMFVRLLPGVFARTLAVIFPKNFGQLDALFSFRRKRKNPIFSEKLHFKNPVSEEVSEFTVDQLRDQAVDYSVKLLLAFEPLVSGKSSSLPKALSEIKGPSLNFGLPETGKKSPTSFSPSGFKLRGLRYSN